MSMDGRMKFIQKEATWLCQCELSATLAPEIYGGTKKIFCMYKEHNTDLSLVSGTSERVVSVM